MIEIQATVRLAPADEDALLRRLLEDLRKRAEDGTVTVSDVRTIEQVHALSKTLVDR